MAKCIRLLLIRVQQRHRREPEPDGIEGWEQTQIGPQQVDLEIWSLPQQPIEERRPAGWGRPASWHLARRHPGVEIPSDQQDSALGAQHRRLDVLEVIGRIDDAGELIGTCHAPARLAGGQQGTRRGHSAVSTHVWGRATPLGRDRRPAPGRTCPLARAIRGRRVRATDEPGLRRTSGLAELRRSSSW